jgi:hypothetical protein
MGLNMSEILLFDSINQSTLSWGGAKLGFLGGELGFLGGKNFEL